MGIETIILIFGGIIAIAVAIAVSRGRRAARKSEAQPKARSR
jgi:hypothetical protein